MNRTCCIIPAYNEEKHLSPVLRKLKGRGIDIIVIDDGSSDKTSEVAIAEGSYLIKLPSNKGKGYALRCGFKKAAEDKYDIIMTMDADGQHNTEECGRLLEKISSTGAGIIIGNRLHRPKGMPVYRFFINKLFSCITSAVCGQKIYDAACGYRAIKKKALESIKLESDGFDIDFEILIKAAKAGFKIESIKIDCIYAQEVSSIRPLDYWRTFFRLIGKELSS